LKRQILICKKIVGGLE